MATFPTLSVNPVYPLTPDGDLNDVMIRSSTTADYELTRPRTTRSRRNWGVSFNGLTQADKDTLDEFEEVTLVNGADAFVWVHPLTNVSYTVRLAGPINWSAVDFNLFNASMKIRQV